LFGLAAAALNGWRACLSDVGLGKLGMSDLGLSNFGVNQRWNRITGAGLTDDDRRRIASIEPFKEDLP
jgi:hypothetical protein